MVQFSYHALSADGKSHKGELDARDRMDALRQLRREGLSPVSLSGDEGAIRRLLAMEVGGSKAVTAEDRAEMMEQLALLLGAGMTMEQSLALLIDTLRTDRQRQLMQAALDKLRAGEKLTDCLAEPEFGFSRIDLNLIRAGELSATLPAVLNRLAEHHRKTLELKSQLISALTYPTVLVIAAIGVVLLMVTVVLPRFEPIFANAGEKLPLLTRILWDVSQAALDYGPLILLLLALPVLYLLLMLRSADGRARIDALMLKVGPLRRLVVDLGTVRFARALSILTEGGVSLQQALALATRGSGNRAMDDKLREAGQEVEQGRPLWQALEGTGLLPRLSLQFMRIGEETNQLPHMLTRLADIIERRMEKKLNRLTSLLTPVVTLIMGIVVGLVIWSIMSAVLGINELV
ncbi:type II secretion system F family protein [Emcibacter nanhaiensis]|uniref:General secretion pathway protein F n=1 Tax=Emcibacter nanhaiensis TaxID=1505037 RepID=A0A501PKC0_9PROT|nr:type II secretion system F family protein [Emcibacter nanhaiensis]TPD60156.1 type II secretion system F family protein [Emcibacter nanhaiensis]